MNFLKNWVINIVTTMVFVTIIEIMMPEGSTRKYARLVTGLMVMFVIINPLMNIMAGDFNLGQSVLETSRSIQLKDVSAKIERLEQGNRESISKLYKTNLEEQIKKDVEDNGPVEVIAVEVETDAQYDSGYFGKLISMRVVVQDQEYGKLPQGSTKVERIEIDVDTEPTRVTRLRNAAGFQDLRELLARTYNVPKDGVTIELLQGDR